MACSVTPDSSNILLLHWDMYQHTYIVSCLDVWEPAHISLHSWQACNACLRVHECACMHMRMYEHLCVDMREWFVWVHKKILISRLKLKLTNIFENIQRSYADSVDQNFWYFYARNLKHPWNWWIILLENKWLQTLSLVSFLSAPYVIPIWTYSEESSRHLEELWISRPFWHFLSLMPSPALPLPSLPNSQHLNTMPPPRQHLKILLRRRRSG